MRREADAPLVMPVVSLLLAGGEPPGPPRDALVRLFGPVALESGPFPFDLSGYYEGEMGGGLTRRWICFAEPGDPSRLTAWKHDCTLLEDRFADGGGRRRVNLDPGYLDLGKLVLASFKSAPDKLYVGGGVWAHTCLRYRYGGFTAPDHSFPDFRDGRFSAFFTEARKVYRAVLRARTARDRGPAEGS